MQRTSEKLSCATTMVIEANEADVRKDLATMIEINGDPDVIDEAFKSTILEVIAHGAQKMYVQNIL
jgi:hypothetical protein